MVFHQVVDAAAVLAAAAAVAGFLVEASNVTMVKSFCRCTVTNIAATTTSGFMLLEEAITALALAPI